MDTSTTHPDFCWVPPSPVPPEGPGCALPSTGCSGAQRWRWRLGPRGAWEIPGPHCLAPPCPRGTIFQSWAHPSPEGKAEADPWPTPPPHTHIHTHTYNAFKQSKERSLCRCCAWNYPLWFLGGYNCSYNKEWFFLPTLGFWLCECIVHFTQTPNKSFIWLKNKKGCQHGDKLRPWVRPMRRNLLLSPHIPDHPVGF